MHGVTKENINSAFYGMFDTLQKRCKVDTLTDYVLSNEKLAKSVVSKYYTKQLATFKRSNENITRSIATYYSSGVMGKRKYQSVRLVLSMKSREEKEVKLQYHYF